MNTTISTVFLFFPDFPHNPYNGVVCNDTITATGVFGSKELWDLAKGERKGTRRHRNRDSSLRVFLFPCFFRPSIARIRLRLLALPPSSGMCLSWERFTKAATKHIIYFSNSQNSVNSITDDPPPLDFVSDRKEEEEEEAMGHQAPFLLLYSSILLPFGGFPPPPPPL